MTCQDSIRLDDLCTLVSAQVDPRDRPDSLYVGLEHLRPGRLHRFGGGVGSDVQSHKSAFIKGDVLYGKLRPYLDKAIVADQDGVSTTELLVLRPFLQTDAHFIAGVLHSQPFIDHAMSGVTGVQHPRTSWQHIREFQIPMFTEDQRRSLGDVIALADDAVMACDSAAEAGFGLKRAAMQWIFAHGLHGEPQKETEIGLVPESWRVTTLGEACNTPEGQIQTGPFGSQLHASDYQSQGTPVINPTHLEGNRISTLDVPRVDLSKHPQLERHRVEPGDVLFARRGEIGRHGLVSEAETGWLCGTGCFLVRVRRGDVDNAFLSYFFSSESVISWLTANAAGTIMPNLNNVVLSRLPVIVPETTEQRAIVNILDAIDQELDLKRRKSTALNALCKALASGIVKGDVSITAADFFEPEAQKGYEEVPV